MEKLAKWAKVIGAVAFRWRGQLAPLVVKKKQNVPMLHLRRSTNVTIHANLAWRIRYPPPSWCKSWTQWLQETCKFLHAFISPQLLPKSMNQYGSCYKRHRLHPLYLSKLHDSSFVGSRNKTTTQTYTCSKCLTTNAWSKANTFIYSSGCIGNFLLILVNDHAHKTRFNHTPIAESVCSFLTQTKQPHGS